MCDENRCLIPIGTVYAAEKRIKPIFDDLVSLLSNNLDFCYRMRAYNHNPIDYDALRQFDFKFIPVFNGQKKEYEILFTKNIIPLWKEHYKDTEFLFNKNNYEIICEYLGRKPNPKLIRDFEIFNNLIIRS